MAKRKKMTPEQVRRLEAIMPAVLTFIEANISEEVRRAKTTHAFGRYRKAMTMPLDTGEGLTERGLALLWAVEFLMENYTGSAIEIADAFLLLDELGLIEAAREAPSSSAKH
jgi:hypothetical protein